MNRNFHTTAGVCSALSVSAIYPRYKSEDLLHQLIGLSIGGYLGARLPDILDPPTNPRHRSLGHGILPCTYSLNFLWESLSPEWEIFFIKKAEYFQRLHNNSSDPFMKVIYFLLMQLSHFFVWMCKGLIIGYASHLLSDFTTPMGLPIFF